MSENNLTKQQQDLDNLIKMGNRLYKSLCRELGLGTDEQKKKLSDQELPVFRDIYESWYSEAIQVIKLLLPDRINDFILLYRNEKRKELNNGTYTVFDYMMGITASRGGVTIVGLTAVLEKYDNQLNILKAVRRRFESSLFEIRQVVQADLFDDELKAAEELVRNGFYRGAGVIAGVVLEKHLAEVALNHILKVAKKNPTIADYNDLIKDSEVIDVATWRFIQHLGDVRNLCGHNKEREPEKEEVQELIRGVAKIIKTIH